MRAWRRAGGTPSQSAPVWQAARQGAGACGRLGPWMQGHACVRLLWHPLVRGGDTLCEAAAAATGQCSPRGFGDGLRMPGARARSVFDRASVHSAHRTTNKGYVTVNQGKDAMACIHAPNGAGICWPGGKTGYNEVRSESTQVDHLSRSRRILTCLVCLSVRAACHVSVMPGRQHITRKAQVTPGGSRDHGDARPSPRELRAGYWRSCVTTCTTMYIQPRRLVLHARAPRRHRCRMLQA